MKPELISEQKLIAFEAEILAPYLQRLSTLAREIENNFEKPAKTTDENGRLFWRYANPKIEHAIIQRLYRCISGLRSCYLLLRNGQILEIGVLLRTITEFQYDIIFLLENYGQEPSEHQKKLLESTFKEAYKNIDVPFEGIQEREMVPRKKVLASVARHSSFKGNTSDTQKLVELDTDLFSGYVHGVAAQTFDIYGHSPRTPNYHPFGVKAEYTNATWLFQLLVYLHRTIHKTVFIANSFDLDDVKDKAFQLHEDFMEKSRNYGYNLDFDGATAMDKIKMGISLGD